MPSAENPDDALAAAASRLRSEAFQREDAEDKKARRIAEVVADRDASVARATRVAERALERLMVDASSRTQSVLVDRTRFRRTLMAGWLIKTGNPSYLLRPEGLVVCFRPEPPPGRKSHHWSRAELLSEDTLPAWVSSQFKGFRIAHGDKGTPSDLFFEPGNFFYGDDRTAAQFMRFHAEQEDELARTFATLLTQAGLL